MLLLDDDDGDDNEQKTEDCLVERLSWVVTSQEDEMRWERSKEVNAIWQKWEKLNLFI